MSESISLFVYIVWIIAGASTVVMIGIALYAGLRQKKNLVYWRAIKLGSSFLAIIGLALFLLNFEKTIRDAFGVKAREYNYAAFVDLKFYVANQVSAACGHQKDSHQAELTCFDLRNVDNGLSWVALRDGKPFQTVVNWQHNPDIDEFIKQVNSRLDDINGNIPAARAAESFLSVENRIYALTLALVLIIASLAGSIGEAAYQLAQARAQATATSASVIDVNERSPKALKLLRRTLLSCLGQSPSLQLRLTQLDQVGDVFQHAQRIDFGRIHEVVLAEMIHQEIFNKVQDVSI